jgi:hypothetical protein
MTIQWYFWSGWLKIEYRLTCTKLCMRHWVKLAARALGLRDFIQIKGPHIANFVFGHPLKGCAWPKRHGLRFTSESQDDGICIYFYVFSAPYNSCKSGYWLWIQQQHVHHLYIRTRRTRSTSRGWLPRLWCCHWQKARSFPMAITNISSDFPK